LIHKERIKYLNDKHLNDSDYVLYWMQNAQRVDYNHALAYAVKRANELNKELVVYFGLDINFKGANYRHFYFMLEGLKEVYGKLNELGIKFIIDKKNPSLGIIDYVLNACLVVVDKGYMNYEKQWRLSVSKSINCPFIEVETNLIVPIEEASIKEEYGAYTIRNKIMSKIDYYTNPLIIEKVVNKSYSNIVFEDLFEYIKQTEYLDLAIFKGGYSEAKKHLSVFKDIRVKYYSEKRNDPSLDYQSNLSPYLHFGQISPIEIYNELKDYKEFIEELVVRRELSFNFVYYNKNYDHYSCLPDWALNTLDKHKTDKREYIYTKEQLELSQTHDKAWNACQNEMVKTGKMHGYMRMYWGKKIIEWTNTSEEAFVYMIDLNNKYNLDGRDPNSYAGIAWCFGKHDRPWGERDIFGMVRYMNYAGLKRKYNIEKYINKWGIYEK
jgi:deoxyribodipyrimidine photo-lyase